MGNNAPIDARFQKFRLGGVNGPTVTACMWCGCVVIGVDALHEGRCAGEGRHYEDEAIAQELFEEAVASGLYDDEETS